MAAIISGPAQLDWTIYAGDANRENFEFSKGNDPWDITGATLAAQARLKAGDVAVALTATCTVDDATLGRATVEWDGEDVRTLLGTAESWTGVWDLQVLEVGETLPTTVLRGKLVALMDVTRA